MSNGISSIDSVRLITEIVTDDTGVKVTFGDKWQFDTRTRTLTIPKYSSYFASEIGAILHEVGHSRFSETDTTTKTEAEHRTVNAFEDRRIEDKMREVYGGADGFFKAMYEEVGITIPENGAEALYTACAYLRAGYEMEAIVKELHGAGQLFVADYIQKNATKIVGIGGDSTNELARNLESAGILEVVRGLAPKSEARTHEENVAESENPRGREGIGGARMLEGRASQGIKARSFSSMFRAPEGVMGLGEVLMGQVLEEARKYSGVVGKIRERSFTRYAGGYDSGKITTKRLARLFTGKDTRLFTRKVAEKPEEKITYSVMVDLSGSMRGASAKLAMVAGVAFALACERAGIPCTVHAFNKARLQLKGLSQRANLYTMLQRLEQGSLLEYENTGWNCDGKHMKKELEEILKRPEGAKRIVVFSDGEEAPCAPCRRGKYPWLSDVVKQARKAGVRVSGIGILSGAVSIYGHGNYTVAETHEEIAGAVRRAFTL